MKRKHFKDGSFIPVCWNCGSIENVELHHIVPICNGGNDIQTNVVPLCSVCHDKAHGGQGKGRNVRAGMQKAREAGWPNGRPGRKSANYEYIMFVIANFLYTFGGHQQDWQVMKHLGIGRTAYCKAKKMLIEDCKKEEWNHSFDRPEIVCEKQKHKKMSDAKVYDGYTEPEQD